MTLEPLFLIAPLLVAAIYFDLRYLRIPNLISIALVGVFAAYAFVAAPDDLLTRLLVAAVVFALGFLAFAARLVGGGDVKLLPALLLFIPADGLILFANLFSAALLIGVAIVVALRRSRLAGASGWKSLSQPRAFPMGLSIGFAGLAYPIVCKLV